MNILYQFNEKYVPYAGVSITSLLENNKDADEINIYVLGEKITQDSVLKLETLVKKYERNVIFKETSDIIAEMKKIGVPAYRGSYAANIRLFCPMFLEKDVDRILYLDADTIVTGSLQEVIDLEMGTAAAAMALDSLGYNHKLHIGLESKEHYYNSGVILFDMNNWTRYNLSETIMDYVKANGCTFSSPDQDLLNVVCKNHIKLLLPIYNMQPVHMAFSTKTFYRVYCTEGYYRETEMDNAIDNVRIYHTFRFLGEFPWHKDNRHPNNMLFDHYIKLSPWNDYKKEKADASAAMRIEKMLYCILPKGIFLRIFKFFHGLYVEKSAEILVEDAG